MTIAFDIDGTWSLDPTGWRIVLNQMLARGHTCIFVTGAEQPMEKLERLIIPPHCPIIVSGGDFKERAALKAGYSVDVWIDDMPGMIQECRVIRQACDDSEL